MLARKNQDQGIITLVQQDYLAIPIESLLIDRRVQGWSMVPYRSIKRNFILKRAYLLSILLCTKSILPNSLCVLP